MTQTVAEWFVLLFQLYAALGFVLAVPFVLAGVNRIDPLAARGTLGFRLLILPGAAAFWPLLVWRWMRACGPPTERSPHRAAAARRAP